MLRMRRRLACCSRDRQTSLDLDQHDGMMTYDGLENCIIDNQSHENERDTSREDACASDSFDETYSSCSSSKDASGSFSFKWLTIKRDEKGLDEWELSESPQQSSFKEKHVPAMDSSDKETIKEKFAKLLLGEDVTGGRNGLTTALSLSNAITNLAASVFGEFWKLEPLQEERKNKWIKEMDLFLSPTNYMVELVPAKQNSPNGRTLEIMTPQARADIHMNLPALRKLDSILIETLDSMAKTEFWYSEVGSQSQSQNKSTRQGKRWWLPSPQVPLTGLSDIERKKLLHRAKVVHQVFKAAKSINENILLEMPVPTIIRDALPKSGKASLGETIYRVIAAESSSVDEMLHSFILKSEHTALEVINKLEAAVLVWKEKLSAEHVSGKSPVRTSWSFVKDSMSELDKIDSLLNRAVYLIQEIKTRYPNLPQSFINATKIQYGKDIGHSILEAYSRVLGNLAFSILCRMGEVLQEDCLGNLNSPISSSYFSEINLITLSEFPSVSMRTRHSFIDQMNQVDGRCSESKASKSPSDLEFSSVEAKASSVSATPSRSRVWCIGREACISLSPENSP